jgi:hypothetical protein
MKRTWITVKRGLLEPKHRFALGELVWLYLYILDITNWEEGVIEEWLDRGASEDLEMPLATLRDQRRKLEEKGYISTERKQHGVKLIVHNWTNPREYTGKVYNKKSPSDTPSDTPSFNLPDEKKVSSYSQKSQITNQKSDNTAVAEPEYEPFNNEADMPQSFVDEYKPRKYSDARYNHVAYSTFYSITKRKPNKAIIDYVIETIGDKPDVPLLRKCYTEWIARGYNPQAYKWLEWYVDGIPERLVKKDKNTTAPWSPTPPDADYYDIINR